MIIGLTGPVASGKNEIAKILHKKGFYVIDADKVGHDLLANDKALCRDLIAIFGSEIENPDGSIDRGKLGKIVFDDLVKLKQLGHIMHPVMKKKIEEGVKGSRDRGGKKIVINAAVLEEMGLAPLCDKVWVVMSSSKKRLERLMKKGISRSHGQRMINAQKPKEEYLQMANVVIENDTSLKQLSSKVLLNLK